jgi:hypothetical protein
VAAWAGGELGVCRAVAPGDVRLAGGVLYAGTSLGQGTGLGLSLSFDLARRFGGSLEARNGPGGGAEFELRLPAAAAEGSRR